MTKDTIEIIRYAETLTEIKAKDVKWVAKALLRWLSKPENKGKEAKTFEVVGVTVHSLFETGKFDTCFYLDIYYERKEPAPRPKWKIYAERPQDYDQMSDYDKAYIDNSIKMFEDRYEKMREEFKKTLAPDQASLSDSETSP